MIETAACQGAGTDADIQIAFTDSTGKVAGPLRIREVDGDCFESGVLSSLKLVLSGLEIYFRLYTLEGSAIKKI